MHVVGFAKTDVRKDEIVGNLQVLYVFQLSEAKRGPNKPTDPAECAGALETQGVILDPPNMLSCQGTP